MNERRIRVDRHLSYFSDRLCRMDEYLYDVLWADVIPFFVLSFGFSCPVVSPYSTRRLLRRWGVCSGKAKARRSRALNEMTSAG